MTGPKFHQILSIVLFLIILSASISAGVPGTIRYQGRLTDTDGTPVDDNTYSVKFVIYGSDTGDDSLWYSGFQAVIVTGGLFDYDLGSFVAFPQDLFIG